MRDDLRRLRESHIHHFMDDDSHFEVASGGELRRKYGLTAENRPKIQLDPSAVPSQFQKWIPLAERWGVSDDLIRDDCLEKAPLEALRELAAFNDVYDEVLDEWLTAPETRSKPITKEYIAFSALGMAMEVARVILQNKGGAT
jgi:hypothetical protein